MSRRLIFTRQTKQDLDNHYVVGAGVGAKNASVRQALKRRANNAITRDASGNKAWGPCIGFCPISGWKHFHVGHPRPSRPLTSAERAVKAFEQFYNGSTSVQLPSSITVSAKAVDGGRFAGQFEKVKLLRQPDALAGHPDGTYCSYDNPGLRYPVIWGQSAGYTSNRIAGFNVISGKQETTVTTFDAKTCSTLGGCSVSFGGAVMTVKGGNDVVPGHPPSATQLTFHYATF